jgi:hypothetical protein
LNFLMVLPLRPPIARNCARSKSHGEIMGQ